jgi:hypothetical protein
LLCSALAALGKLIRFRNNDPNRFYLKTRGLESYMSGTSFDRNALEALAERVCNVAPIEQLSLSCRNILSDDDLNPLALASSLGECCLATLSLCNSYISCAGVALANGSAARAQSQSS